jgi:hypothetical protein
MSQKLNTRYDPRRLTKGKRPIERMVEKAESNKQQKNERKHKEKLT